MTTPYARFVARRNSLTSRPADLAIPCAGSGVSTFLRVRARFLHQALDHEVTGFRAKGRVDALGRGAVEEEHPFGGSVIEGYHHSMTVVLDAAVVQCEDDGEVPDAPTMVKIWCVDEALRTELQACVLAAIA